MKTDFKIICAMWAALIFSSELPGKIEANVYPVLSNMIITIEPTEVPFRSKMYLEFEKRRDYCSFESMNLYMISKDFEGNARKTAINRVYEGEEIVREGGKNYAGPWILNASVDSLKSMEIEVEHECHPLWDVTTILKKIDGVMQ